jgi:hypothetical protein
VLSVAFEHVILCADRSLESTRIKGILPGISRFRAFIPHGVQESTEENGNFVIFRPPRVILVQICLEKHKLAEVAHQWLSMTQAL